MKEPRFLSIWMRRLLSPNIQIKLGIFQCHSVFAVAAPCCTPCSTPVSYENGQKLMYICLSFGVSKNIVMSNMSLTRVYLQELSMEAMKKQKEENDKNNKLKKEYKIEGDILKNIRKTRANMYHPKIGSYVATFYWKDDIFNIINCICFYNISTCIQKILSKFFFKCLLP